MKMPMMLMLGTMPLLAPLFPVSAALFRSCPGCSHRPRDPDPFRPTTLHSGLRRRMTTSQSLLFQTWIGRRPRQRPQIWSFAWGTGHASWPRTRVSVVFFCFQFTREGTKTSFLVTIQHILNIPNEISLPSRHLRPNESCRRPGQHLRDTAWWRYQKPSIQAACLL